MSPQVCLDTDWLMKELLLQSARFSREEIFWSIVLRAGEHWCAESIKTCVDRLICESLSSFCIAASVDQFRTLVLLEPPANDMVASQIVEHSRSRHVTVCVDHFYHAELLSRACQRTGASIGVIIEVDAGQHHVGVRPGYDAQRVAIAAHQLPGLRVVGVSGRLPEADQSVLTDRLKVLRHSLTLIHQHAKEATRFLVRGDQLDPVFLRRFGVNEVGDMALLDLTPLLIRSVVLSRPEFDRAIINVGERQFRLTSRNTMILPSGVQISDTDQNSTVLTLSDRALDLTIGEEVLIRIA